MADDETYPAQAPIAGAGPRLKAAREAAGLSVEQISAQTKIPARMLSLIEDGDFAGLPARTYATGFTRSYARALGLDESEYVAAVRKELGLSQPAELRHAPAFEPGDPARVPTARFALLAAVAALVVVAAGLFFWRTYYAPAVSLPPMLPPEAPAATAPAYVPAPPPAPTGPPAVPAGAAATAPAAAPEAGPVTRPATPQPGRPRPSPSAAVPPPAAPLPLESPVTTSTAQN